MRTTFLITASGLLFSSITHASPITTIHQRAASVAGYSYEGCHTDSTSSRALIGSFYYDDIMTLEKCAIACSKFTYFGVEYGKECFCSNQIEATSVLAPAEEDCSFPCPGNAAQACGAGDRINIYKSTATTPTVPSVPTTAPTAGPYTEKGCYTEATSGRALSEHVFYDDAMTTEKCADACAAYTYFGIEYHRECYCSNTIAEGSVPAPAAECNFACDADPTQSCGGDWRLNMFTFETSTTTPVVPTPAATPSNYVSEGCHTDNTSGRALTGALIYDDGMTVEKCSVICSGYSLFGVEYGRECFCGNALQNSVAAPATECNFPCAGNRAQTCGGGDRLNVFRYGSPTPTDPTPSTPTPVAPVNVFPNGDFEATSEVGWASWFSYICPTCPSYDFKVTASNPAGVTPHGGSQMATILYKPDSGGYMGIFERKFVAPADTTYSFSAWHYVSQAGANCQVRYYFQPVEYDPANPHQAVTVEGNEYEIGSWQQVTTEFTSGSGGVRQIAVQVYCIDSVPVENMLYFDDIFLSVV